MSRALRSLVVMLGLGLFAGAAPATARAESCPATQKKVAAYFRGLDRVGQQAVDLMVKCMFTGPNDKALARLSAAVRKAFKPPAFSSSADRCLKSGDVIGIFQTIGHAAGQRIGLAYGVCSSQVQAHVATRTKAGATTEQVKAEIAKMGEAWMADLLKQ